MKCAKCGNEFTVGVFCPECGFKNEQTNQIIQESLKQESRQPQVSNEEKSTNVDEKSVDIQDIPNKGKGLEVASLICGIISILTIGLLIIPEVLGIVFAMVSKKSGEMQGTAKAGFICSIVSIVLLIAVVVLL